MGINLLQAYTISHSPGSSVGGGALEGVCCPTSRQRGRMTGELWARRDSNPRPSASEAECHSSWLPHAESAARSHAGKLFRPPRTKAERTAETMTFVVDMA